MKDIEDLVNKFISTSMPELIYPTNPDFGLDDLKFNQELLKKLSRKKSKIHLDIRIEYAPGKFQELLETGLGENGYIYFALNDRILYLVKYKRENVSLIGDFAVTQFLVWADRRFNQTRGLAEKVFFEHLLNKHKIIVSDYTQTPAGMRFWQNRISDAFDKKLFVYSLDSRHKKVVKLNSTFDLDSVTHHWREDNIGKLYRFAISDHPLEEKE